ncbi:MAG: FHA domain-containing protein [Myxococcota bacterium]
MSEPNKHFRDARGSAFERWSTAGAREVLRRRLRLELRTEGVTRAFAFLSEDDRAVVVGSLLRADLRIDRPGVAPVHFQFERRGDQIFLIPSHGVDLRLNAACVVGPCAIGERAVIEFLGVVVAASASASPQLVERATDSDSRREIVHAETIRFQLTLDHAETVKMFQPYADESFIGASEQPATSGTFATPKSPIPVWEAFAIGESEASTNPTRSDDEHAAVLEPFASGSVVPIGASEVAPVVRSSDVQTLGPTQRGRFQCLATLGLLTMSRPLLVTVCAALSAALLAFALLGASRVLEQTQTALGPATSKNTKQPIRPAPAEITLPSQRTAQPAQPVPEENLTPQPPPHGQVSQRRRVVSALTAATR